MGAPHAAAPEEASTKDLSTSERLHRFIRDSAKPALMEPGEELLHLHADNFQVVEQAGRVFLQAWDERRNIVRLVRGIKSAGTGQMELVVEKFGKRRGQLLLLDTARPTAVPAEKRGARMVLRERFRRMLSRQFSGWKIRELSSEPDLEHSLSPVFPRALLSFGSSAVAAIIAPAETSAASEVLSFGLIWLDLLRRRELRLSLEGLALFLPAGFQRTACLRLPYLDPQLARLEVYVYSPEGHAERLDPQDYGNLDSSVKPCMAPVTQVRANLAALVDRLAGLPGVEQVQRGDGEVSLRVRGLQFAWTEGDSLYFGLRTRHAVTEASVHEAAQLACSLVHMRSPGADDPDNPFFRCQPESWLESQVRCNIRELDPSLLPHPIHGQVPALAGGERGVIDLLAADSCGRLTVLELKTSQDLHLPLQALDYWIRVNWHLERGDFARGGYFPGIAVAPKAPRLLLVSPALEFHPTTETILRYFSPRVETERIGLNL